MASTRIDPARSAASDRRLADVLLQIQRRDTIGRVSSIGMIVLAVPLLFIGPLVLATIFWFVTWRLHSYVPWTWFFWGMTLLVIPAMLWGEAKQRGGFFAGGNFDISPGGLDGNPLSPVPILAMAEFGMLAGFVTNPRLAASGLVEIFLVGPRLLMDGWTTLRRARQVRGASRLRAAQIVLKLAAFDQGIATATLIQPHEPRSALLGALALLGIQEWIGFSSTGDRVWLLSNVRKHIPQ